MRLARLIIRLEERKVVVRLGRDPFALFIAISYYVSTCQSPRCMRAMGVCQALALFVEGKSGPVESGLTGLAAAALNQPGPVYLRTTIH